MRRLALLLCSGALACSSRGRASSTALDATTDAVSSYDARSEAIVDVAAPVDTAGDAVADAGGDGGAALPAIVGTVVASTLGELATALAAVAPGSTVCLADGTYTDANLVFNAVGTAARPIVVSAEHPGRAILTGRTQISMGGAFATLQGFVIRGGQSLGTALVELKNGTTFCTDCRVTELAILDVDVGNATDTKWVSLYGQRDRVDHCVFSGKTNPGTLLVVWRQSGRADDDRIDHSLFANRPPMGTNGNEAIRVGTGAEASSDSRSVIEDNLFLSMSADAEVISIKSGANIIRHNTIRASQGTLTLRNGRGSTVDANVILADGVANAGGIRVIGPGHTVTNNYVEGVRTTSSARGGLSLVSGESSPGPGGYAQVTDALVAFNTVVDCDESVIFGADANPLAPARVTFANNLFAASRSSVVASGGIGLTAPTITGNIYFGAPLGFAPSDGFRQVDALLMRGPDGLLRPSAGSPAIDAASASVSVPTDIDGQTRSGVLDVGCDEVGAAGPARRPLSRSDVGPLRYAITVP